MPEDKTGFIDTNIWLYAFIDDDARKKDISHAIIQSLRPVVSVQIINEICVNLIKRAKFPEAQIGELIETFYQKYEVVEMQKSCSFPPRACVKITPCLIGIVSSWLPRCPAERPPFTLKICSMTC